MKHWGWKHTFFVVAYEEINKKTDVQQVSLYSLTTVNKQYRRGIVSNQPVMQFASARLQVKRSAPLIPGAD